MPTILTPTVVTAALSRILETAIPSEYAELETVELFLKDKKLPLDTSILRIAHSTITDELALQLINGVFEKDAETKVAVEFIKDLCLSEFRTIRVAGVKMAIGITEKCIIVAKDPHQSYMDSGELTELVSFLYSYLVEGRCCCINPYERSYVLQRMVAWFVWQPEVVVTWEELHSIIRQQMFSTFHSYSITRQTALKQLSFICNRLPNLATTIANQMRNDLEVIIECDGASSEILTSCRVALEILQFCSPPLPRDTVQRVLQKFVSSLAPKCSIVTAMSLIWTEKPNADQLYDLVTGLTFDNEETFARFAKCFTSYRTDIVWKHAGNSIDSPAWGRMLSILTYITGSMPDSEVLDFVTRILTKYGSRHAQECAQMLKGVSDFNERYFSLIKGILVDLPADEKTADTIGEIVSSWTVKALNSGGLDIVQEIRLDSVPLNLAGWVQGPTIFQVAEQTRHLLLNLTNRSDSAAQTFLEDYSVYSRMMQDITVAQFSGVKELAAVFKMLVQLYCSFHSVGSVPLRLRSALDLRNLYNSLPPLVGEDGFEEALQYLYLLEELGAVRTLSSVNVLFPDYELSKIEITYSKKRRFSSLESSPCPSRRKLV